MGLDVSLYVDVDTGGKEPIRITVFDANITHNLTEMANEAKIYNYLWRPEELNIQYAEELIEPLQEGIARMLSNPDRFREFNAPNEWGTYDQLLPWVEEYLEACEKHPKARVEVNR